MFKPNKVNYNVYNTYESGIIIAFTKEKLSIVEYGLHWQSDAPILSSIMNIDKKLRNTTRAKYRREIFIEVVK